MIRRLTIVMSLLGASHAGAQQVGRTPVVIDIPAPPIAVPAIGRLHLVYELHITNLGNGPLALAQIDVLDGATLLESWSGVALAQRLLVLGQPRTAGVQLIPAGGRAVAFAWLTLPAGGTPPAALQHRLFFSGGGSARDAITSAPVLVRRAPLPTLAAPLRGGPWIAIRGPSATSGHRLALVGADGRAGVPQRFAIDWAMLGPDGKLFHGDSAVAENWYGYGRPVYAAAKGKVVVARDGTPDGVPFNITVPAVIEAVAATGNVVVLEIGSGQFLTYAHLKPGSLKVKVGSTVAAGQQLGEVGNSGNSLGPHLHFHLNSAAEPLSGEGLPYVLRSFELIGRMPSRTLLGGAAWAPLVSQAARQVALELPLEDMVVRWTP